MAGKPWTETDNAHLRKWAGIKTAVEIAADIGRTETAVFRQMNRLGLRGVKRGEKHRLAKTTRVGAMMIKTLHEAGYQACDIYSLFEKKPTLRMVQDICAGRTWSKAK